jgi:L-aspartate oxidase
MTCKSESFDLIVLGTGIAGLSSAIRAAQEGCRVAVLSKETSLSECNTHYAQGGIVAFGEGDSVELLQEDIERAGAYLNNHEAVSIVSREGPRAVKEFLIDTVGVPFCPGPDGEPDRTREAAHSVRRIYHVKDRTGASIEDSLLQYALKQPSISFFPASAAIDIITNTHHSQDKQQRYQESRALGVYVFSENTGEVVPFFAPAVLLATGGLGNLYLHTSNPPGATGDGVAMASRAGAEIVNAEFVQFHPTVLFHRDIKRFLISESMRGEGARLMNRSGEYFMERYQPGLKDLAPRDQVARAIYLEMEATDSSYVFLDTSGMKIDIAERFPSIFETCKKGDIDIRTEPIPVVPAAHFFCGGVRTGMDGQTSLRGLFAVGETACTGVHGANRLASVSLLEGLVFGLRAGKAAAACRGDLDQALVRTIPDWVFPVEEEIADSILIGHDLQNIQTTMWDYVGIIRTKKRMGRAIADLNYLDHRIEDFYKSAKLSRKLLELRNAVLSASLVARAAQANPVSLGCHYIRPGSGV